MKQTHSTKWRRSVQPRKQRKYLYNLPDHLLGSQLRAHLAEPLRKKYGVRAVRVRVGDKVKVLRGTHKGKEGKVERVEPREGRLFVSKVEVAKRQGGTAPYPLRASNLLILELAEEKRRFKRRPGAAPKGSGPAAAKERPAAPTASAAPSSAPATTTSQESPAKKE